MSVNTHRKFHQENIVEQFEKFFEMALEHHPFSDGNNLGRDFGHAYTVGFMVSPLLECGCQVRNCIVNMSRLLVYMNVV